MSIDRVDVLGVGVSAINMEMAVAEITRWIEEGERHYVCVTGVHGVMESQDDPALKEIHNRSGLTTPDGMPMVWAGHKAGADYMSRVYGPDMMLEVSQLGVEKGWKHFYYGGAEDVPPLLAEKMAERFPGIDIVGTYSPPFRPLTDEESAEIIAMINDSGADLVWVGLSTPKQERWMDAHRDRLNAAALLGVGAAFDMHAGRLDQAPLATGPRPRVALSPGEGAKAPLAPVFQKQPALRRSNPAQSSPTSGPRFPARAQSDQTRKGAAEHRPEEIGMAPRTQPTGVVTLTIACLSGVLALSPGHVEERARPAKKVAEDPQ